MVIWYISPRFGILYKEKSGNPDAQHWIGRFVSEFPFVKPETSFKGGSQPEVLCERTPGTYIHNASILLN
jgi:hypothetical protein